MAGIFLFTLDGRASPLSIVTADGQGVPLRRLPYRHSQHLRERATAGPWIETWTDRPWHPYNRAMIADGITEVATIPIRHRGGLIGILVASQQASANVTVAEELPALVEFVGLIGVALGPAVAERLEVQRAEDQLSAVIRAGQFYPVFQPIVDIRHGLVVAYEALTRFADGTPPDVQFEKAANVGLGTELDLAAMHAAIEAARALPAGMPLHLNASPATVVAGATLRGLIQSAGRPIVLEVTEHAAVEDYDRLRDSLAALGTRVELAVDDAGAGFASLRHVVELRPAVIKLDRSVVEGLDHDPAREALVAGMVHVARDLGCRLVAEGVETEAELGALRRHGLFLIQGYLLGRPARIEQLAPVPDRWQEPR
jgi:EAL domain-containing protein (putative c-di-GMP-specific phosphodiesterase class I)